MHVFIIGSKGIPARYGGFETFVHRLTAGRKNTGIQYHVSCLSDKTGDFKFNDVRCFNVKVPSVGSAGAVLYDIFSLINCYRYINNNGIKNCVIYILACRIGPFLSIYRHILKNQNIKIYVNPDGHEWLRDKWNKFIKMYWKFSERLMIRSADLVICDSKAIEAYIKKEYSSYGKKTVFIPYGADIESLQNDNYAAGFAQWKNKHLVKDDYYLLVGRFVPENNYDIIISEFIASGSKRDLIIISNVSENKFYKKLLQETAFNLHPNIKFVGTVYDQELLALIRRNAFAYLHGHEVGGTNPSLLEGMATTRVNLLLDVAFNKEVADDSALYFSKREGSLAALIKEVEEFTPDRINELGNMSKKRIRENYSWDQIIDQYELLFCENARSNGEKL